MLNFINRDSINRGSIAGWRPFSSRSKLLLWQAHAASSVQALEVLTISPMSGSCAAHHFQGTHLLKGWWLRLCQHQVPPVQAASSVKAFSSKEQPAAVPRTQSGCFLAGSLQWDTSLGTISSCIPETSVTATSLPFLAQTWSTSAKETFLGYIVGLGSDWSLRWLYSSEFSLLLSSQSLLNHKPCFFI